MNNWRNCEDFIFVLWRKWKREKLSEKLSEVDSVSLSGRVGWHVKSGGCRHKWTWANEDREDEKYNKLHVKKKGSRSKHLDLRAGWNGWRFPRDSWSIPLVFLIVLLELWGFKRPWRSTFKVNLDGEMGAETVKGFFMLWGKINSF